MAPQHFLTFLVAAAMAPLPCYGFITERSGAAGIPTSWNTASFVKTEQEVTTDRVVSEKTQTTNVEKLLQTFDAKKLTKSTEQPTSEYASKEKRLNFTPDHLETEATGLKKVTEGLGNDRSMQNVAADNIVPDLQNVILLFVEANQDRENFWKDFKASYSFSTEGSLQNCQNNEIDIARFLLDDALVFGSKDQGCDCDRFLRSNIAALLFWARDVKGMTTGTVSNIRFAIPTSSVYEEPVAIAKDVDDTDKSITKSEIRGDWYSSDAGKSANRASFLPFASNVREDEETSAMVFEMFSKIRRALRSIIESFGGVEILDESIPQRKSHIVSPNLADIISELYSIPDEKGFVLVAVTSANEVNSAMKLLQHQTSQDTLVVVSEVCSHDNKPVPFLAQGPSATMLYEASTIWDLPTVIKNAIVNGCQGATCRIRRHEALPLLIPRLKRDTPNSTSPPEKQIKVASNNTEVTKASLLKDDEKMEDSKIVKNMILQNDEKDVAKFVPRGSTSSLNGGKFTTTFASIASIVAFVSAS